jgi:subtilase family serine protease
VPPPPPNFQIGAIKAPAAAAPGATINVRDTTRNAGIGDAPASTTRIWLSTNKTLGIGDVELGARNVPELAAGAQDIATTPVTIPSGARGAYFLLLESDADDEAVESNEMDNIKAKAIGLGPDLTITSMVFDPSNPTSNTPTTIKLTVKNIGADGASPSASRLYKSKNGKLDGADTLLAELPLDALAAGATATQSTTLTLPAGTYYVLAVSDAGNAVAEANETNNLKKTQKTVP